MKENYESVLSTLSLLAYSIFVLFLLYLFETYSKLASMFGYIVLGVVSIFILLIIIVMFSSFKEYFKNKNILPSRIKALKVEIEWLNSETGRARLNGEYQMSLIVEKERVKSEDALNYDKYESERLISEYRSEFEAYKDHIASEISKIEYEIIKLTDQQLINKENNKTKLREKMKIGLWIISILLPIIIIGYTYYLYINIEYVNVEEVQDFLGGFGFLIVIISVLVYTIINPRKKEVWLTPFVQALGITALGLILYLFFTIPQSLKIESLELIVLGAISCLLLSFLAIVLYRSFE